MFLATLLVLSIFFYTLCHPTTLPQIFISKYASACIYTSLNIECGLHAHVPCVLASNVDYMLVLHKYF